jgi:hypothetical protein
MPYFKVISGEAEYGTEAMGLGELALHYIVWALKRAADQSVILIEEPETFIAEQSQSKLMDFIAERCVQSESWAVITTHSQHILRKVQPNHTAIVAHYGDTTKFIVPNSEEERLTALGLPASSKQGVLLTEDKVGMVFVTTILERQRPILLQSLRILHVGGSGNVVTKVNEFPKLGKWFRAIGLLDGDERDKGHVCEGMLTFLPTNSPPEVILQEVIVKRPDAVSEALRIGQKQLELALSSVEGMEHHEWLEELAKRVDKDLEELARCGFEVWMHNGENAKQCEVVAGAIIAHLTNG